MIWTALGFISGRVLPWVLGGLLALLAAGLTVQTLRAAKFEAALAAEQRDRADERTRLMAQALTDEQQARAEGQRRVDEQQEVIRHAQTQLDQARADGAAAGAAADRLRQRAAALAAGCSRPADDSAAASPSPADGLASALATLADAGRRLAEDADRAVIAGRACEAAYESLTPAWPTRLPSQQ
jgi:hypothetical protein